jgi:hypothetical protein
MTDSTAEEKGPQPSTIPTGPRKQFRPLRAWPAVLLALLIVAARFGLGISEEAATKYWMAEPSGAGG